MNLPGSVSEADLQQLARVFDGDGDGHVDYSEFVRFCAADLAAPELHVLAEKLRNAIDQVCVCPASLCRCVGVCLRACACVCMSVCLCVTTLLDACMHACAVLVYETDYGRWE